MIAFPAASINLRQRGEWDPVRDLPTGLIIDLYPNDAGTLTLNGSNIAAIANRVAGGVHFVQASATLQPTLVVADAGFGGRSSIRWNGDVLASNGNVPITGGRVTVAWVEWNDATSIVSEMQFSMGPYSYVKSAIAFLQTNGAQRHEVNRTGSSRSFAAPTITPLQKPVVFIGTWDIESLTETAVMYRDSITPVASFSSAAGTVSTFDPVIWYFGAGNSVASYGYKGKIARFTAWDRVLSSGEIQTVLDNYKAMFNPVGP